MLFSQCLKSGGEDEEAAAETMSTKSVTFPKFVEWCVRAAVQSRGKLPKPSEEVRI